MCGQHFGHVCLYLGFVWSLLPVLFGKIISLCVLLDFTSCLCVFSHLFVWSWLVSPVPRYHPSFIVSSAAPLLSVAVHLTRFSERPAVSSLCFSFFQVFFWTNIHLTILRSSYFWIHLPVFGLFPVYRNSSRKYFLFTSRCVTSCIWVSSIQRLQKTIPPTVSWWAQPGICFWIKCKCYFIPSFVLSLTVLHGGEKWELKMYTDGAVCIV